MPISTPCLIMLEPVDYVEQRSVNSIDIDVYLSRITSTFWFYFIFYFDQWLFNIAV